MFTGRIETSGVQHSVTVWGLVPFDWTVAPGNRSIASETTEITLPASGSVNTMSTQNCWPSHTSSEFGPVIIAPPVAFVRPSVEGGSPSHTTTTNIRSRITVPIRSPFASKVVASITTT